MAKSSVAMEMSTGTRLARWSSIRSTASHEQTTDDQARPRHIDRARRLGESHGRDRRCLERPGICRKGRGSPGQRSLDAWRAAHAGWRADRRLCAGAQRACSVYATSSRASYDLRRPGRHRDRERAAVRRGAGAHARPHRSAATADRDRRSAESHQPLGVRSAGGVAHVGRVGVQALRRAHGPDRASRRRRLQVGDANGLWRCVRTLPQ